VNRFFIEKINIADKIILLDDPAQLHHLRDVLRARKGEEIAVFDPVHEYLVKIVEIGAMNIKLEVKEKRPANLPGIQITVACAIPKKVKMDDIVDKLTQLGVVCIIPLETERVVVKLDKQKKAQRQARWEKIAMSAVKQSQRSSLVTVKPVSEFKEIIAAAGDFDLKLIPTLENPRSTLKKIFEPSSRKFEKILILIGPEGDFSPKEISLAKEAGFLPVDLGRQVLRVDTAAIAAVSFIKLNAEN